MRSRNRLDLGVYTAQFSPAMNSDDQDSKTTKEQPGQRKGGEAGGRQARQAQALRENLRKRKAQVRARRSPGEAGSARGPGESGSTHGSGEGEG